MFGKTFAILLYTLSAAKMVLSEDIDWSYQIDVAQRYKDFSSCTKQCFLAQPDFAVPITKNVLHTICTDVTQPGSAVQASLVDCATGCHNVTELAMIQKLPFLCESAIVFDQHRKAALLNRDDIPDETHVKYIGIDLTESFEKLHECPKNCVTSTLTDLHVSVTFPLYMSQAQKICAVVRDLKIPLNACLSTCTNPSQASEVSSLKLFPVVCKKLAPYFSYSTSTISTSSKKTRSTGSPEINPNIVINSSRSIGTTNLGLFFSVLLLFF